MQSAIDAKMVVASQPDVLDQNYLLEPDRVEADGRQLAAEIKELRERTQAAGAFGTIEAAAVNNRLKTVEAVVDAKAGRPRQPR